MPIRLNVGLSKKVGLPDFGSLGAVCNVDIELSHNALDDLEAFHRQARNAFACRQAVEEVLARSQEPAANTPATGTGNGSAARKNNPGNGTTAANNGNGPHLVSGKQIGYPPSPSACP